MRSTYWVASFTVPPGAGCGRRKTGALVVNPELCQNPGFRPNRRAKSRHLASFQGLKSSALLQPVFRVNPSRTTVSAGHKKLDVR